MAVPLRVAIIAAAMVPLVGCGGGSPARTSRPPAPGSTSQAAPAPQTVPKPPVAAAPVRPPVELRLELPLIGLSSAPVVHYETPGGRTTLHGSVEPAHTSVYMLDDEGNRKVVNPRADGSFAVAVSLSPGNNNFIFTAARLGEKSQAARLVVNWTGHAADARRQAIAADPAKYLPPASAGLNRKLPSLQQTAPTLAQSATAITFKIDPITADPPPASGGTGRWLGHFELTEYYPTLEAWFSGAPVPAPGLSSPHRVDWLYSARGLSMEGDGIGLDGHLYHVDNVGRGGWITASGNGTARFGNGDRSPFWRTGGFWRTDGGALTYPLASGGWSAGVGARYVPPPAGISFAPGPSLPLGYLRSVAVDPRVIPLGSRIFIPAYQQINGGWFEADDTGGAIIGRHIDVFRPPPAGPEDTGNFATNQTVYIVPPGAPLP